MQGNRIKFDTDLPLTGDGWEFDDARRPHKVGALRVTLRWRRADPCTLVCDIAHPPGEGDDEMVRWEVSRDVMWSVARQGGVDRAGMLDFVVQRIHSFGALTGLMLTFTSDLGRRHVGIPVKLVRPWLAGTYSVVPAGTEAYPDMIDSFAVLLGGKR